VFLADVDPLACISAQTAYMHQRVRLCLSLPTCIPCNAGVSGARRPWARPASAACPGRRCPRRARVAQRAERPALAGAACAAQRQCFWASRPTGSKRESAACECESVPRAHRELLAFYNTSTAWPARRNAAYLLCASQGFACCTPLQQARSSQACWRAIPALRGAGPCSCMHDHGSLFMACNHKTPCFCLL